MARITAALLEAGAQKDVVDGLPPASRAEPPLAPVVGDHLYVNLLQHGGDGGHTCREKANGKKSAPEFKKKMRPRRQVKKAEKGGGRDDGVSIPPGVHLD